MVENCIRGGRQPRFGVFRSARVQEYEFEMKVLEECHRSIQCSSLRTHRTPAPGFISVDERLPRFLRGNESAVLEAAERGFHEEPADIGFHLSKRKLVEVDSGHAFARHDEDIVWMKIAVRRYDSGWRQINLAQ